MQILKLKKIPKGIPFWINDYDGGESIFVDSGKYLKDEIEKLDIENISFEELKNKIYEYKKVIENTKKYEELPYYED